jgi:hypothetical protein
LCVYDQHRMVGGLFYLYTPGTPWFLARLQAEGGLIGQALAGAWQDHRWPGFHPTSQARK